MEELTLRLYLDSWCVVFVRLWVDVGKQCDSIGHPDVVDPEGAVPF